ncbi:MAG: diaminopimelate epimerase [Carbonactinosporaceae bacterium]
MAQVVRFLKGHGTQNDFVVLPDPGGRLDLTPGRVTAVCDRRSGIGADGVLRAVRSVALTEGRPMAAEAEWFMDYRNADGSLAEMCGNGIRVFARYLVDAGLAEPGELRIGTRAGVRAVRLDASGDVTVDMGPAEVLGEAGVRLGGTRYEGLRISVGNPHLACVVGEPVAGIDLSAAPEVDPGDFPDGVNVEVVNPIASWHLTMRVHERGSGETRSCGTGAVAAAVAGARAQGRMTGTWRIDVPGGRVAVTLEKSTTALCGPAVLVGDGELRADWWAGIGR